jgi:hypothetical protein
MALVGLHRQYRLVCNLFLVRNQKVPKQKQLVSTLLHHLTPILHKLQSLEASRLKKSKLLALQQAALQECLLQDLVRQDMEERA